MSAFGVSTQSHPTLYTGNSPTARQNVNFTASPRNQHIQGFWIQEGVTFRCQGKPSKQSSAKTRPISSSPTSERGFGPDRGHTKNRVSVGRQSRGRARTEPRSPTRMTNIWRRGSRWDGSRKAERPTSAEEATARRSERANRPLSGCSGFIDRPRPLPIAPETRRHSWD